MGAEEKKKVDKIVEEHTYQRLSKRERDLLLIYEDKTILLFGDPRKGKNLKKL